MNTDKMPFIDPSRSRSSVSGQNSCSDSHKSGESSKKGGSSETKGSKRDLAMQRIEEMKERSRLEALEEETQLQMLKVKQKQIERQRRELVELQKLSKLVEEESECDEELEELAKSDTSYIDKVQGWMNSCNAVQPGRSRRSNTASVSQFSLLLPEANVNEIRRRHQTQQRNSSMVVGPTALQIASRQVFPRNLPAFAGQPQDWPLFISAYEQANASPPMWGANGGLNVHFVLAPVNVSAHSEFMDRICSAKSRLAPTKLVALSEKISTGVPRLFTNLRIAISHDCVVKL